MFAKTLFPSLMMSLLATVNGEWISASGWRPISSEKVFGTRNFIKTQVNRNSEARNADSTFADVKFADAREIFAPTVHSEDSYLLREEPIQSSDDQKYNLQSTEQPSNRIPKKLSNEIIEEEVDNLKHTYEISEEAEDMEGEQSITVDDHSKEERNPTRDLFKILSNYNIRSSDRLPNYSLSLRQNSRQSSGKDYMYVHVPIRIPLGYNSPDHLPVDPVLAVVLSKYGQYLPGYYGIHGNYRNLYGYAASNNIHNNKPFGSYKLFSDTY